MFENFSYFISLRKKKKPEIIFNIGRENENIVLLRVRGKYSPLIFQNIILTLSKYGATVAIKLSNTEEKYAIREDLGPIVGSYLILIKRARKIATWNTFFNKMISGEYPGIAKAFTSFLELAVDLSKSFKPTNKKCRSTLSPKVVTALSISLKRFVKKMIEK